VEPHRLMMHKTNSGSGTMIPYTDSGSRAVIPTQKEPRANSKIDSEPRATNKLSANSEIDSEPKAKNSTGNAKRIDPKRDLQITSRLNGQQRSSLRLRRILRPTFKVQEN
jgi:hypothetical protein